MEENYKELTYEEALEFYNRWGRTILVGSSTTDYYEFNKLRDKKSLDDCIKQYLNYYDGPVRFFLNQKTIDYDMQLKNKNESKNMNKKLKKLTESYLHRVVSESIYKVIKEDSQPSQLGIDPDKIARFLFDNGIDVYQFTHQVEDVYEMLRSENQSSDPRMTLVNTIKNSSDFDDTTEQYGCQAGDAPLSKPIGRFSITRLGFILNNGKVRFYGFRVQDGEWIDNIEFGEEQIPQIIRLIR